MQPKLQPNRRGTKQLENGEPVNEKQRCSQSIYFAFAGFRSLTAWFLFSLAAALAALSEQVVNKDLHGINDFVPSICTFRRPGCLPFPVCLFHRVKCHQRCCTGLLYCHVQRTTQHLVQHTFFLLPLRCLSALTKEGVIEKVAWLTELQDVPDILDMVYCTKPHSCCTFIRHSCQLLCAAGSGWQLCLQKV